MNHLDTAIESALTNDPNIRDEYGGAALIYAASSRPKYIVELVLDRILILIVGIVLVEQP